MKKITSIILAVLMVMGIFAVSGCGKEKEKDPDMAELLVGDWYSHNGAAYRTFNEDGTVTGANGYSSEYSVKDNMLTWDTVGGESVTLEYWTDGEILRISSKSGAYFTTRKYYYRTSEGVAAGTGLPQRGTTDKAIFGKWYNGNELFFNLKDDGTVSGRRDIDGFSFFGNEIVLFTSGFSVDEAAECRLENDVLTIIYTDEATGEPAELVLTKEPSDKTENPLSGLTDDELFLPEEEKTELSATDAE